MAYGSPATLEDVEAYYTHIRGGRKPSEEQLADLLRRYRAIGGPSPLLEITRRQAASLKRSLEASGSDTSVYVGMKHSPPFIADVVREAAGDGVTELLCIALAPHYSSVSIGGYARSVEEATASIGHRLKVRSVKSWHDRDDFVSMWASRVAAGGVRVGPGHSLVFSAHSLPERILREGDPYRDQLLESSVMVAERTGWKDWSFAFQSASKTGEPWLGPDIVDHLEGLRLSGSDSFLLAPIGFVSDHLEILYDIDVECSHWAKEKGVKIARCRLPNDGDDLTRCLANLVNENQFS